MAGQCEDGVLCEDKAARRSTPRPAAHLLYGALHLVTAYLCSHQTEPEH
jgi:hypothetical protein